MAVNGANGTTRAARRRIVNDTPTHGAGAAGDNLAAVIGQTVALELGKLFGPVLAHLASQTQQKTACLYCAARRKLATEAGNKLLADAQREYEIVCKAAAELDDTPPEFTPPALPELPAVQEACTWIPVSVAGAAPCAVPVCFDDMPTAPAAPAPAEPVPAYRPTGLVDPIHQQPILAPGE